MDDFWHGLVISGSMKGESKFGKVYSRELEREEGSGRVGRWA
jgi:hypothetical protein